MEQGCGCAVACGGGVVGGVWAAAREERQWGSAARDALVEVEAVAGVARSRPR